MASIAKAISRCRALKSRNFVYKNLTAANNAQKLLFHLTAMFNVKGQQITMPSLSPTMEEGKIIKWLKKEGDVIKPGDVLCDIQTDKAIVSLETEEEGILAKIIVNENSDSVQIGTLIALFVLPGEDWTQIELPSPSEISSKSGTAGTADGQESNVQPAAGPVAIQVKMPSLSPTMTAGTIVTYYKKEGDQIASGDVLCDIQTDKAVVSYESDEDGVLAKIIVPEGTKDVKVGTLIALIVGENEDWKSVVVPSIKANDANSKVESYANSGTGNPPQDAPKSDKTFGPAVRSLLSVYQLEPDVIKATGRNNKILKEDVLKYIEENKLIKKPPKPVSLPSASTGAVKNFSVSSATPSPIQKPAPQPKKSPLSGGFGRRSEQRYVDIELSNIRKIIAKRLTESKFTIPHAYSTVECSLDQLMTLRSEMMHHGVKASVNDYLIKAVSMALENCPRINVIREKDQFKISETIDISVAVATPNGLITPIVKNASQKGVTEISDNVKELAGRARIGKLRPEEFQGGSFTISNLGMYGIKHFTAVINPPQSAILAVGSGLDTFKPDRKTHKSIMLTLSYDRRAIQEDEAAEFLDNLRNVLENPRKLIAPNISVARAYGL